ncbi:hypothetical protein GCU56_17500 [Geodermatophilus sabuli]|uniref:Uncharacterized protein n=1 Tax=Geodermatophilus sabuli TaxID=1564158 RepID=A0A7K3W444_9ACTN|nr:hypothetical protein [Geodermatophilus sabuli]NEK59655.1 hypothetical protein [Geodermatophilus sabuli]
MALPELETRLRNGLQARAAQAPPAPRDLAARVRQRARQQRRARLAVAGAGLAAALVLVGVPVIGSNLATSGSGEVARPSERPPLAPRPTLYDVPTRGSLAGDDEWLADVAARSWLPDDAATLPPGVELPDPPVADRRVAFAGDTPGGRVALVLGRLADSRLVQAWFTGPAGAEPGEMSLAGTSDAPRFEPTALWDAVGDEALLVVVGLPGDEVEVLTGRTVSADGTTEPETTSVAMTDGAGALLVDLPAAWPGTTGVSVRRAGQTQPLFPRTQTTDELDARTEQPVGLADPRGLATSVDAAQLQWAARSLLAVYGRPAEALHPTILAAGPVAGGSGSSAVLLGVTFPSGATATLLLGYRLGDGPDGATTSSLTHDDPAPAGTALLDRVVTVVAAGAAAVSGPAAGRSAEVLRADGSVLTTIPLVAGGGVGSLADPGPDLDAASVRIRDGSGSVLAEAPATVVSE